MNMVLDATPVMFLHPINGRVDTMPVEMIAAYVPFASHLRLEEAARVACVRDEEGANNLLGSFADQYSVSIPESVDEPSAQPEAVR